MVEIPVKIEELLLRTLPGTQVRIEDTRGDGRHYALWVSSPSFEGRTRLDQHRMVHRALGEFMNKNIVLAIRTAAPGT